jgi:hypothetical protein
MKPRDMVIAGVCAVLGIAGAARIFSTRKERAAEYVRRSEEKARREKEAEEKRRSESK